MSFLAGVLLFIDGLGAFSLYKLFSALGLASFGFFVAVVASLPGVIHVMYKLWKYGYSDETGKIYALLDAFVAIVCIFSFGRFAGIGATVVATVFVLSPFIYRGLKTFFAITQ